LNRSSAPSSDLLPLLALHGSVRRPSTGRVVLSDPEAEIWRCQSNRQFVRRVPKCPGEATGCTPGGGFPSQKVEQTPTPRSDLFYEAVHYFDCDGSGQYTTSYNSAARTLPGRGCRDVIGILMVCPPDPGRFLRRPPGRVSVPEGRNTEQSPYPGSFCKYPLGSDRPARARRRLRQPDSDRLPRPLGPRLPHRWRNTHAHPVDPAVTSPGHSSSALAAGGRTLGPTCPRDP